MPAGSRGHKIREYKRRIDSMLEDERDRRAPPPPSISEEHAALRERIAETCDEMDLNPKPAMLGAAHFALRREPRPPSGRSNSCSRT